MNATVIQFPQERAKRPTAEVPVLIFNRSPNWWARNLIALALVVFWIGLFCAVTR